MKSTLRVAGGLLLVLVLLVALGAISVSAQGPSGSGTPSANQTPAQAPAAPGGSFSNAAKLGGTVQSVAAGAESWYQFNYDNGGNTPAPAVTVRLINGVSNGLNFEIWSNERIQSDLSDDKPVGRGTQEVLPGCTTTLPDGTTARCTTNDLTWTGGFGAPGTYYIRIVNGMPNSNGVTANNANGTNNGTSTNGASSNTTTGTNNNNGAVTPQLIVSGPGLLECGGAVQNPSTSQNTTQNLNQNQGFAVATCENLAPGQLPSNFNTATNQTGGTSSSGAGNAPGAAATPAATTTSGSSSSTGSSSSSSSSASPAGTPTP